MATAPRLVLTVIFIILSLIQGRTATWRQCEPDAYGWCSNNIWIFITNNPNRLACPRAFDVLNCLRSIDLTTCASTEHRQNISNLITNITTHPNYCRRCLGTFIERSCQYPLQHKILSGNPHAARMCAVIDRFQTQSRNCLNDLENDCPSRASRRKLNETRLWVKRVQDTCEATPPVPIGPVIANCTEESQEMHACQSRFPPMANPCERARLTSECLRNITISCNNPGMHDEIDASLRTKSIYATRCQGLGDGECFLSKLMDCSRVVQTLRRRGRSPRCSEVQQALDCSTNLNRGNCGGPAYRQFTLLSASLLSQMGCL